MRSHAQARLGDRAAVVTWIAADVTRASLPREAFDIWHDRAVFHFLTQATDRAHYIELARNTIRHGGTLVMSTFALDGPARCSGLDVVRYDVAGLAAALGEAFVLERAFDDLHETPAGALQHFTVAVFAKR